MEWLDAFAAENKKRGHTRKLKCYYCFQRLTEKAIRKRSIVVIFENSDGLYDRKTKWLSKFHIIHERFQNKQEVEDAWRKLREFTVYTIFPDEKPYFGNLERALSYNFLADANHVSENERNIIRDKLRKEYNRFYGIDKPYAGQTALILE